MQYRRRRLGVEGGAHLVYSRGLVRRAASARLDTAGGESLGGESLGMNANASDGDGGVGTDAPPGLDSLARRFLDLWQEQAALMAEDPAATEAMAQMLAFWQPFLGAAGGGPGSAVLGGSGLGGGTGGDAAAGHPMAEAVRTMQALQAARAGGTTPAATAGAREHDHGAEPRGGSPDESGPGAPDGTAAAAGAPDGRDRLLLDIDRRLRALEERLDSLASDAGAAGGSAARGSGGAGGRAKKAAAKRSGPKRAAAKRSAAKRSAAKRSGTKRPDGRRGGG